MRAPFNTTATLYDGPQTATPGFPRVVDAPCRLIPDPYFKDLDVPLSLALSYFTIEIALPFGPQIVDQGGGEYLYKFRFADRVEFAIFPGIIWAVLRVELCTWPTTGAPYWRAHVADETDPVSPCSVFYHTTYVIRDTSTGTDYTVTRTGPTTWVGSGWTLESEISGTAPGCLVDWRVTGLGFAWTYVGWNGVSGTIAPASPDPLAPYIEVHP